MIFHKLNSSLIINGIQRNKNNDNNNINKNEEENNKDNSINQIKKKILCMHEFSKTGYADEDEKKVN